MSGGSYNYLCDRDELVDLLTRQGALQAMADRLAALGYAADAARETEELLVLFRQWQTRTEVRVKRLAGVWQAVEWWDSGDWGEERLRQALAAYRADPPVDTGPLTSPPDNPPAHPMVLPDPEEGTSRALQQHHRPALVLRADEGLRSGRAAGHHLAGRSMDAHAHGRCRPHLVAARPDPAVHRGAAAGRHQDAVRADRRRPVADRQGRPELMTGPEETTTRPCPTPMRSS